MAWRAAAVLLATLLCLATTRPARADQEPPRPDLTTPRRAVGAFLEATELGEYDRAALALDLEAIPSSRRAEQGREAARMLHVVLERVAWVDLALVSDDPRGRPDDGEHSELVTTARIGNRQVPITLTRSEAKEGEWHFSSATVSRIPALYEEHGPGPIERRVPEALRESRAWGLAAWQWLGLLLVAILAIVAGRVVAFVMGHAAARVGAGTKAKWDDALVNALRPPARFFLAALLFQLSLDLLALSAAATHVVSRLASIATIGAVAWIATRVVTATAQWIEQRAKDTAHNSDAEFRARGIATQVRVLRRVANVAIGVLAVSLMLMQIDLVRTVGVSLLASAGLAGVVLGFAAQRTIGSLIAGIQMSATQPISLGDVVVVEKEWGTIEEITLTYVVVKVWDERRLIVPMTRFLEQPFENWTKSSAELHGTVFVHVDWTCPVEAMRTELDRLLDGHPSWDGRTKSVLVTDAKERTLEVRILVSAADAGALWSLRVDVREKIVRWLQELEGGRYLPRLRHEARE